MLSYASASTSSAPHSSSPLNPHRSSSPPLSSPTPGVRALPLSFTPRGGPAAGVAGGGSAVWRNTARSGSTGASAGAGGSGSGYNSGSSGTSTPLSARYVRGSGARRTPRPTAPPNAPSLAGDLFSEASTPTQAAMLREKFARRMARHERARSARHADLAVRRGTAAFDDGAEDEDARVAQAQADDEERRRDRHAAERAHELETGGSDPALPDFWDDGGGDEEEERWAAEAEEAAMAERIEAEMAEAACADGIPGDDEDWAAIAAMLDAQDQAGHHSTAPDIAADADAMDWE